jgi:hypothetical protein
VLRRVTLSDVDLAKSQSAKIFVTIGSVVIEATSAEIVAAEPAYGLPL